MKIWGLAGFALLAGACASTTGVPRPAAFPSAPTPAPFRTGPVRPGGIDPVLAAGEVIRAASLLQGIRYRLGGESPLDGFDCSGFVRYVYGRVRIPLPRTVTEQFVFGRTIRSRDVREGDLVFFSTTSPGPSHVGIAVGNGTFIHAPGASGVVRVERLDAPYWQSRLVAARRVL